MTTRRIASDLGRNAGLLVCLLGVVVAELLLLVACLTRDAWRWLTTDSPAWLAPRPCVPGDRPLLRTGPAGDKPLYGNPGTHGSTGHPR